MKERLTEAIIANLEDEIDAREGLAALAHPEGTLSLEAYLETRKRSGKRSA